MEYEELLAACARTVGAPDGSTRTLHDVALCLMAHGPTNRALLAEMMVRFMVEYIEGLRVVPRVKH